MKCQREEIEEERKRGFPPNIATFRLSLPSECQEVRVRAPNQVGALPGPAALTAELTAHS